MESFQSSITMNKIPATQLESTQLKRLAAQRQLYSDAKVIQAVQIVLSVLSVLILWILIAMFPKFAAWSALYGGIVTVLNVLCFSPWQQTLKEKAAKIQELFDCDVLELPWRELTAGSRLEMEIVEKYSSKYKRKVHEDSDLEDWYPKDVGKLPLHLGRIICQRSNCWWEVEQRRSYANWVLVVLSLLAVVTLFLGVIRNFALEKFILAVVIPLMPAFVLGIQQYRGHKKSAERLDQLMKHVGRLWDKAYSDTNPEELTRDSRDFQDEIYNHRRTSPIIFNWIYKYFRKEYEGVMNKAANELITEALESSQE